MIASEYKEIRPLRTWVQKVLPLVYDDSLSYYELLNKVVFKLNLLIENNNVVPDLIKNLIQEYITPESIEEILSEIFDDLRANISSADEKDSSTATADRVIGDWVWLNDELYVVLRNMDIGDAYIIGGANPNVEKTTVENEVKKISDGIIDIINNRVSEEANAREEADNNIIQQFNNADDVIMSSVLAVAGSVALVAGNLADEVQAREDADTIIHSSIMSVAGDLSDEVQARIRADEELLELIEGAGASLPIATPQNFGAVGDGVANDTSALSQCLNGSKYVLIPRGTYRVTSQINVGSNVNIVCSEGAIIYGDYDERAIIKFNGTNIYVNGLNITGNKGKSGHTGTEYNHGIYLSKPVHTRLENCKCSNLFGDGFYIGCDIEGSEEYPNDVVLNGCTAYRCGRNGYSVVGCDGFEINNCCAIETSGNNPQKGIDIEPNSSNFILRGTINNFYSKSNYNGFLQIYTAQTSGGQTNVIVNNVHCVTDCNISSLRNVLDIRNDMPSENGGSVILNNIDFVNCRKACISIMGTTQFYQVKGTNLVARAHYGTRAIVITAASSGGSDQGYIDLDFRVIARASLMTNFLVTEGGYPLTRVFIDYTGLWSPVNSIGDATHEVYLGEIPKIDTEVSGSVTSAGVGNFNISGVTASKIGTGNYNITLPSDFANASIIPVASGLASGMNIICYMSSSTVCRVTVTNASGTATDSGFNIIMKAYDPYHAFNNPYNARRYNKL